MDKPLVPGVVCEDATSETCADRSHEAAHAITVTCDDRAGLLADLSEHIRTCGVDIVSATVATDTSSGFIVDSFAVRAAPHCPCAAKVAAPCLGPGWGRSAGATPECGSTPCHHCGHPRGFAARRAAPACTARRGAPRLFTGGRACDRSDLAKQVRDAKSGGRLAPALLDSLSASLWQVAIGAAHPKRLSGGAGGDKFGSAARSPSPTLPPRPPSRTTSYGALSLTTVGEARPRRVERVGRSDEVAHALSSTGRVQRVRHRAGAARVVRALRRGSAPGGRGGASRLLLGPNASRRSRPDARRPLISLASRSPTTPTSGSR